MLVDRLVGRRSIRGRSFRQDSAFRRWKRIEVQWRPQDPFRGKTETDAAKLLDSMEYFSLVIQIEHFRFSVFLPAVSLWRAVSCCFIIIEDSGPGEVPQYFLVAFCIWISNNS